MGSTRRINCRTIGKVAMEGMADALVSGIDFGVSWWLDSYEPALSATANILSEFGAYTVVGGFARISSFCNGGFRLKETGWINASIMHVGSAVGLAALGHYFLEDQLPENIYAKHAILSTMRGTVTPTLGKTLSALTSWCSKFGQSSEEPTKQRLLPAEARGSVQSSQPLQRYRFS